MEIIKQYVDLLVKRNEESLEFKRVHSEWEMMQTDEARELVISVKARIDNTEKEIKGLYTVLKEKGLAVGGNEPWGSEMKRYEYWLVENHASGEHDATTSDNKIVKQYVDLLIKRKAEFNVYQKLIDEWKTLENKINEVVSLAERAKERLENTRVETDRLLAIIKEKGLMTCADGHWDTEMERYSRAINENPISDRPINN